MALAWPDEHWAGKVFNLGGECSQSIKEIAVHIADVYERRFGHRPQVCSESSAGSAKGRPVDFRIDRLKAEGFAPRHDWEVKIAATFALCPSHRAGACALRLPQATCPASA